MYNGCTICQMTHVQASTPIALINRPPFAKATSKTIKSLKFLPQAIFPIKVSCLKIIFHELGAQFQPICTIRHHFMCLTEKLRTHM